MLKKITSIALSLIVAFAAIMAIKPVEVHAEEKIELTQEYIDAKKKESAGFYILELTNGEYELKDNLSTNIAFKVQDEHNVTIDLNNHTLTFTDGRFDVKGNLTLKNGNVIGPDGNKLLFNVSHSNEGSTASLNLASGNFNGNISLEDRDVISIGSKATVTIPQSMEVASTATVTNNGAITNNGVIYNSGVFVNDNTLVNNGTIDNSRNMGTLTNNGTLINTGTIENGGAPTNGTINGRGTIINNGNGKISGYLPASDVIIKRPASSVMVNPVSLNLTIGKIKQIHAEPVVELQPRETTDTVSWTSSNNDVATVDSNGNVTANKAGTAVITATAGNVSAVCNVTVSRLNPSLSVEAVATKVYSDAQFQLNVTHNSDGVVSYSSSDPNVLTVDGNGLVSIVNAGTAAVTVSLPQTDKYDAASDTLNITVDKATGSLSIQNAVINKTYGDPDFSVKPSDSTPGTIQYTADGSGVVSVDENGMVHILKAGTAVVTVAMEATDNHHAVSETITINVAEAAPETPAPIIDDKDYVITAGNKTSWQRGSNKQLLIISDGDYDLFNGLYIDGSLVDRSNYEVKKGSTEIYLQPSYLETLTTGRHTFELRYSNGKKASGEFTITEAEKPAEEKKDNKTAVPSEHSNDNKTVTTSSPKTGDNTNSVAWGLIMIAAIICAAVVSAIKKRRMN